MKPGRDLVVVRPVAAPRQPHVADRLGDVVVVRRDEPSLAGGDVLRRVEREARRLREPADLAAAVARLGRVGRVLDDGEAERVQRVEVARLAGEVDGQDRLRARPDDAPGRAPESMLRSSSRTSQKTGVAPQCSITFAVAGQVIGVVITSSPGPTPTASSARCSAAVPEVTASTCSASR